MPQKKERQTPESFRLLAEGLRAAAQRAEDLARAVDDRDPAEIMVQHWAGTADGLESLRKLLDEAEAVTVGKPADDLVAKIEKAMGK